MSSRSDRTSAAAAVTTACRLHWQVARRSDYDVVKAIAQQLVLDAVYCIDYVSLYTDFFEYLRRIGLWDAIAALTPANKERFIIGTLPYVLIYMQKQIAGLPSVNAVEDVLPELLRDRRAGD